VSLQIVNALVNALVLLVEEVATVDKCAGHLPRRYPLWLSFRKRECVYLRKKNPPKLWICILFYVYAF